VLDERAKLLRPYPVDRCDNRDCGAVLDRDAYVLHDGDENARVVFCDVCASSAVEFHGDRFKPLPA
jgi:hypothetical protein